jgi:hypothetical protein
MPDQPTLDPKSVQEAVWQAMAIRKSIAEAQRLLDRFWERYPSLRGYVQTKAFASSLSHIDESMMRGIELVMQHLPAPGVHLPEPRLDERTGEPVERAVRAVGGQVGPFRLVPTGTPPGPSTATIAGIDDHHIALIVPCINEGCIGSVQGVAFVSDMSMSTGAEAACPICATHYRLSYRFGSMDIQITPLGDTYGQPRPE